MAQQTSSDIVRQASTWSIVWGVLLIIFGMLAVGSPLVAAVAVNVIIAWLIVLAGVVHLILAFHAHRAGSLIWKLLVGLALSQAMATLTATAATNGGSDGQHA